MIINDDNKDVILKKVKDFDCKVISIDFDGEMINFKVKDNVLKEDLYYTIYSNDKDIFFRLMDKYDIDLKEEKLREKIKDEKFLKKSKMTFLSIFLISSSLLFIGVSHPIIMMSFASLSVASGISFICNNKIMNSIGSFFVEEGLSDIRKEYLISILKNKEINNIVKKSKIIDNKDKINELVKIKEELLLEKNNKYIGNWNNDVKVRNYIKIKSNK